MDEQYREPAPAVLSMTDMGAANQSATDPMLDVLTTTSDQSSPAASDSNGAEHQPFTSNFLGGSLTDGGFLNSDLFATSASRGAASAPSAGLLNGMTDMGQTSEPRGLSPWAPSSPGTNDNATTPETSLVSNSQNSDVPTMAAPSAARQDLANINAVTTGQAVQIDGGGHALTDVRAIAAPATAHKGELPLGMFDFKVHGVTAGGAATVRVTLPVGFNAGGWLMENPATGALESFDYNGTTGAEIHGNIVTLHFVDGGRGDSDGLANSVIDDPGGPIGPALALAPITTANLSEQNGDTATWTVHLTTRPVANVTVTLVASEQPATLPTSTVTFTPSNWNTPQTVSAMVVNDGVADGYHPLAITATADSTDPNYDGLSGSISFNVVDGNGPNALPVTATTGEDTPVTIPVLPSDIDANGDPLTVVGVTQPANGSVVINPDGSLTYTDGSEWNGADSFSYTIADPLGETDSGTVTVDVQPDDNLPDGLSVVYFDRASYLVSQNDGFVTLQVDRRGDTQSMAQTVTVDYATADGSAINGRDYSAAGGTLVFGPDQTVQTFQVQISSQMAFPGSRDFTASLANPVNAEIIDPRIANVSITGAQGGLPRMYFSSATYRANEWDGTATITVILNQPSQQVVSAQYDTYDMTAVSPEDYESASGTVTFQPGQTSQTFAATINADESEGFAEKLGLTLSNPTNATIIAPNPATLTILEAPQANPDEYAMSADDSSLSIAASGVLYNDYAFGPEPMTAQLEQGTSSGTVVLNSNGSFVYTPNADIEATGGDDSFQYVAVQNGIESNEAEVKIHVVRVTVTTAGLDHSANMTTGAFVPINANNDNLSLVTHEIPAHRDFEFDGMHGEPYFDPDLIEVDVTVNPNVGLPGFFTISVTNVSDLLSKQQIRLWWDQWKHDGRAEGSWTTADLGGHEWRFFMEGMEPSTAQRQDLVKVQYVFVNQKNQQIPAGADQLAATVTPVIDSFDTLPGPVVFVNRTNGLQGMQAGIPGLQAGATFDATVTRPGLSGGYATFVQNVTNIDNGTNGAPAGLCFLGASERPNMNSVLTMDAHFPLLDRLLDPPLPDIDAIERTDEAQNKQRITSEDSPTTGVPPGAADLVSIDVVFRFRVYLVWRFGADPLAQNQGIIYTLAYRDWYAALRADTFVEGQGVTQNLKPDGVDVVWPTYTRSHENPEVWKPIANKVVAWQ